MEIRLSYDRFSKMISSVLARNIFILKRTLAQDSGGFQTTGVRGYNRGGFKKMLCGCYMLLEEISWWNRLMILTVRMHCAHVDHVNLTCTFRKMPGVYFALVAETRTHRYNGNIHVVVASDNDSLRCHKLRSWQFSVFGVASVINNRYSPTRGKRNHMTSSPHLLSNIDIAQTWVLNMDLVFPGKHNLSRLTVLVIVYVRTLIQFTHINPVLYI